MDIIRKRILYIDAYDSFANNIIALLKTSLDIDVEVISHDEYTSREDEFHQYLGYFDAVVAGPGPGDPNCAEDVGSIRYLWRLQGEDILPVLGICLGFQDMCQAFGAKVVRLDMPRHGVVSEVQPANMDIFQGFPKFTVTNYHSLHIKMDNPCSAADLDPWSIRQSCPQVRPLAWDFKDSRNGPVLLAARHTEKPFWGVQYHPESICTDDVGNRIISSWWKSAMQWLNQNPRRVNRKPVPRSWNQRKLDEYQHMSSRLAASHIDQLKAVEALKSTKTVQGQILQLPELTAIELYQALNLSDDEAIILRSGKQADGKLFNEELGRFSIVGIVDQDALHIQFSVHSQQVNIFSRKTRDVVRQAAHNVDVFAYLEEFMAHIHSNQGASESPFWGGLAGFISYEAGLRTINTHPDCTMESSTRGRFVRPDVNLVLVQRSVVIDHFTDTVYVQSIRPEDDEWIQHTIHQLRHHLDLASRTAIQMATRMPNTNSITNKPNHSSPLPQTITPDWISYTTKILACESAIRTGSSYELCLTSTTPIHTPSTHTTPLSSGLTLFKSLSHTNSAPFSAFLRIHTPNDAITIASSSPERFLSWSRPTTKPSTCQFRPIKGTVRKGPGISRADAETILNSSKERAENLMITDLIRHDLHGVAGPGNVRVSKLMQIEEYATVYQLVSVIEGALPQDSGQTGIDVLASSLPPGSMTGAPKRRSCEILSMLEDGPRGIYSGVLGYLDVGGGGDFSVVIRTACRWDGDSTEEGDVWTVGAGGAITVQSEAEDEYAEMLGKLNSTLGAFGLKAEKGDREDWTKEQREKYGRLVKMEREMNERFPGRRK
ncbi:para-aminobenzoate synthase [Microthyrium microscopicum]|uniref:aminodeoxychorismate synthase n=1 Tax=Microthyrium microscopicum TaxID=703497 RepID=A0A6A6UIC2_9PEZI|nr:para-aminobenzoate synthase [Microthyrium microscopicum]